jgi:hypothetical protein
MKEYDKKQPYTEQAANFIGSIYLLIIVGTPLQSPSLHFTKLVDTSFLSIQNFTEPHFTPLHYICQHFTSAHLNFTQLHFTTLSFGLTPFKFPTAPFHLSFPGVKRPGRGAAPPPLPSDEVENE